jgi:uncharacterized protein YkwD
MWRHIAGPVAGPLTAGFLVVVATLASPSGTHAGVLVSASIVLPSAVMVSPADTPPDAPTTHDGAVSALEARMFDLVNGDRAAKGLVPLQHDPELASVARWRSEDMALRGYFSHDIGGYQVFSVLREMGISYRVAGENLAFNTYSAEMTVEAAEQALMQSPTHRDNLLRTDFTHLGVGVAIGADGRYLYTQLFTREW